MKLLHKNFGYVVLFNTEGAYCLKVYMQTVQRAGIGEIEGQ